MSIATALQNLLTAKADIKAAIEEKGVTVSSSDKIIHLDSNNHSDYGNRIREIEAGTTVIEYIDRPADLNIGYLLPSDMEVNSVSQTQTDLKVENSYRTSNYGTFLSYVFYPKTSPITYTGTQEALAFLLYSDYDYLHTSNFHPKIAISVKNNGSSLVFINRTSSFTYNTSNYKFVCTDNTVRCDLIELANIQICGPYGTY